MKLIWRIPTFKRELLRDYAADSLFAVLLPATARLQQQQIDTAQIKFKAHESNG